LFWDKSVAYNSYKSAPCNKHGLTLISEKGHFAF